MWPDDGCPACTGLKAQQIVKGVCRKAVQLTPTHPWGSALHGSCPADSLASQWRLLSVQRSISHGASACSTGWRFLGKAVIPARVALHHIAALPLVAGLVIPTALVAPWTTCSHCTSCQVQTAAEHYLRLTIQQTAFKPADQSTTLLMAC